MQLMLLPSPDVGPQVAVCEGESARVEAAHDRAARRVDAQRRQFRVVRWGLLVAVVVPALTAGPPFRLDGVGMALVACWLAFVLVVMLPSPQRSVTVDVVMLAVMGAAGVGLGGLGLHTSSEIAVSATALLASLRLPRRWAMVVGGASIAALATVFSLISGVGAENVLVSVLLCAALGLVGSLLSRSRADQEQTEVLLARLEDARDAQLEAATLAERARVARELHDVLAHSLSGLAIQLEAARKLLQRDGVGSELQDVVDRAAALAKGGLTDARRAVDALRGGDMASVEHLPELVSHYRDDLGLPVCLAVRGDPRPLTTGASLALYRAAGEALTNVVRHAPGSLASVTVTWRPGEVRLVVDNEMVDGAVPLAAPGPRWGLAGIGERVALVGGRSSAGPTATGWQVQVTVPG